VGNVPASNAARDAEALAYRAQGWKFDRIADQMGYANRSGAQKAVERALAASVRETSDEAKTLILADLYEAKREAWEVLHRRHLTVSNGRVVRRFVGIERDEDGIERLDPDGKTIPVFEDVEDDGPVLAAIDRITRIDAEIAKILGAYAPVRSEIITLDAIESEIRALEAEVGRDAGRKKTGTPPVSPRPEAAGRQ
jgi:hypothetical protein